MALFSLKPGSKLASHSQYINETGAYPCKILSASVHFNEKKGSESIKFEVETLKDGKKANFWVCHSSPNFDARQMENAEAEINSIMLCAGVESIKDDKNGIYQALCGKQIGLVFQMEECLYNGAVTTNSAYRMCFVIETGQTAQEKRENLQPMELNRYLTGLAPIKTLKNPVVSAVNHAMPSMPASGTPLVDAEFSDDVPF